MCFQRRGNGRLRGGIQAWRCRQGDWGCSPSGEAGVKCQASALPSDGASPETGGDIEVAGFAGFSGEGMLGDYVGSRVTGVCARIGPGEREGSAAAVERLVAEGRGVVPEAELETRRTGRRGTGELRDEEPALVPAETIGDRRNGQEGGNKAEAGGHGGGESVG